MKALALIVLLAACGPKAGDPVVFISADAKSASLVAELVAGLNNEAGCTWIVSDPKAKTKLKIDPTYINNESFPGRRYDFGGVTVGDTLYMLGIASDAPAKPWDVLEPDAWAAAFYHHVGLMFGLDYDNDGVMRPDVGGLRGDAARASLMTALYATHQLPCPVRR